MTTAITIPNVDREIVTALTERAEAEGRPVPELAHDLLAAALGMMPEKSAERWRRENAEGLAAYNNRAEATLRAVHQLSAVPIPRFED